MGGPSNGSDHSRRRRDDEDRQDASRHHQDENLDPYSKDELRNRVLALSLPEVVELHFMIDCGLGIPA
jgi:hypothetical protein